MESIQYFQNLKKEDIVKGLYLRDDRVFFLPLFLFDNKKILT